MSEATDDDRGTASDESVGPDDAESTVPAAPETTAAAGPDDTLAVAPDTSVTTEPGEVSTDHARRFGRADLIAWPTVALARWKGAPRNIRLILACTCAVLAVLGLVLVGLGINGQESPPRPLAASQPSVHASVPAVTASADSPVPAPPTTASPTQQPAFADFHLTIPALGVESDLMQLGLNPDKTVEVPPLTKDAPAGWYKYSPTPGNLGPSVILGHIDSAQYGPGVFYRLGSLHAGDKIVIDRSDHMVAEFRVDSVAQFPKDDFPTDKIYGNTPDAQLRLITCGGTFDNATRSYEDNVVAYATLVSLHPR